ncbi:MAG: hypothetical protein KAS93_02445 [Gammaproteobacteria bacterium]|nr:hypothetical protein [Gammaproteobacteria bacterium]
MKKILGNIAISLIYLFLTILPLMLISQIFTQHMTFGEAVTSIAIALFFLLFLVNGVIMTYVFDSHFKQLTLYVSSKDPLMKIYPVSMNFLLKMRFYRGAVYLGAICFHYLPLKPLFANQRYLTTDPEFIESLSLSVKLWAAFMFVFYALCLLAGMVLFVYKYVVPWF